MFHDIQIVYVTLGLSGFVKLTPIRMISRYNSALKFKQTMLLENLESSGFVDRLMAENARIISLNEPCGATNARSTRL